MTLEEKGFRRMLRLRGRNLQLLSGPAAGALLRGTINRIGAYDLNTDLGPDPRGKRILETPAAGIPVIADQNRLWDLENNEIYGMVEIGLDGPAYSQKFMIQQLTDQDQ
jgi:hypothetical protein